MVALAKAPVVHLNARYVPDSARIWCIHGGKSKRVLQRFLDHGVVALDMPGVRMSEGVLADDNLLTKHILVSEAVQKHYNAVINTPRGQQPPPRPSVNPADYALPTAKPDLYRTTYKKRALNKFFAEIAIGDVIVTPSFSSYEPFLFGFVKSVPANFSTYVIPEYPNDPVPSFEVEWIDHKITKRDIPVPLAKLMERQEAVTEIQQAQFGATLYTAVLGAYWGDSVFGVDIDCPRYRGNNPLETVPVQELIAVLTAIYGVYRDEGAQGLSQKSYDDLIKNYYDEEFIASLQNEFHSPGFYRVVARARELGLVLLVTLPLASSTQLDQGILDQVQLVGATQEQQDEFDNLIKPMLHHLNPAVRQKIIEKASEAHQELGASTRSEIEL